MLRAVCLYVPYRFWWYVYVSLSLVAMYAVYYGLRLCFPMSMLGVLLLIHYGLWIVAIIHCGVVVVDTPWFWVAVELFWPC